MFRADLPFHSSSDAPITVMEQQPDFSKTEIPLTLFAQRESVGMEYLAPSEYRKSWPIGQKYIATVDDAQPLQLYSNVSSPSSSIRRKPLPPDSPYSPGNSPRTSIFVSQMPVFSDSSPPKSKEKQPSGPKSDKPEGLDVPDKSVKTVLLAHEHGYESSAPYFPTDPPATKALPKEIKGARYNYKALLRYPVAGDSHIEFANDSDTNFPRRVQSFGRPPFSTRRVWLIVTLVVMIVLVIVLIPFGIGWGNLVIAQNQTS